MNQWDERYALKEYYYGTEPNDFLRESKMSLLKGGKILCLAEGEGRNAVWLASQGFDVTGVDGSKVGLEKMQRLAETQGLKVQAIHADLSDFKVEPSSWDGIVSIWCHLPRILRQKVHRQVVEGLKPGGVFVLEAYTPDQLRFKTGGPSLPELMPTLPELKCELEGLFLSLSQERERDVQEGIGHRGMSAVVQVLARK